jgi:hypothetical protein
LAVDNELLAALQEAFSKQQAVVPAKTGPSAEEDEQEQLGFLGTVGDIGKGVVRGSIKAVEETVQFGYDIANWVDDLDGRNDIADRDFDFVPEWAETQTTAGNLTSGIAQFLVGFVGAGKVLKAAKFGKAAIKLGRAAKYVTPAVQGAIADLVVFDPHEERFSNLIQQYPMLANPVTEYLAASPDDSSAEGRFKNALEGIGLGMITDGVFAAFKYLRKMQGAKTQSELIDAVIQGSDEVDTLMSSAKKSGTAQADEAVAGALKQSDKMKAAGLEPSKELIEAEKFRSILDGNIDVEEALKRLEDVQANGRPVDPVEEGGRGYRRGDGLNTKHAGNENAKDLVQSFDNSARELVPDSVKATQSISSVDDALDQFVKEIGGETSPKAMRIMRGAAQEAEKLPHYVRLFQRSTQYIADEAVRLQTVLNTTADEAAKEAVFEQVGKAYQEAYNIMSWFDTVTTNMGRGMNLLKYGDVRVSSEQITAAKESIEHVFKSGSSKQKQALVNRLAVFNKDPGKLVKALFPETTSGKALALFNEFWTNTVLSGPVTFMVNLTSNAMKAFVISPLDKLVGGVVTGDRELLKEGARTWAVMASQFKDSLQMAYHAFAAETNILRGVSKTEVPSRQIAAGMFGLDPNKGLGSAVEVVGKVINLPGRFLGSTDEFFQQLSYRSKVLLDLEAAARKMVDAGTLPNTKEAISEFVQSNFDSAFTPKKLPNGKVLQQGVGTHLTGLREAAENTWTESLKNGSFAKHISDYKTAHPLFHPIVPFVRTPANLAADAIAHSPLAVLSKEFRTAIKAGGREAEMAIGKLTTGSMLCGFAIHQAMTGNLTGRGPKNKVHREALEATGWKPYSIRVGDKWVSYNRLDPIGMVLGVAADWNDIVSTGQVDDESKSMIAGALIGAVASNITSKTYLRGLSEALLAITDWNRYGESFMRNRALSLVPAIASQPRRLIDPTLREADSKIELIMDRLPYFSEQLPARYSWLTGKALTYHGENLAGISPIVWSVSEGDKTVLSDELGKYSQAITTPSRIYKDGIEMTAAQYSRFCELHGTIKLGGKTLEEALVDLFNSPSYDRARKVHGEDGDLISGRRPKMIRTVVNTYRDAARRQLTREDPSLLEAVKQQRRDKALQKLRSY